MGRAFARGGRTAHAVGSHAGDSGSGLAVEPEQGGGEEEARCDGDAEEGLESAGVAGERGLVPAFRLGEVEEGEAVGGFWAERGEAHAGGVLDDRDDQVRVEGADAEVLGGGDEMVALVGGEEACAACIEVAGGADGEDPAGVAGAEACGLAGGCGRGALTT